MEVMWVSESLSVSIDSTDVTLVSEDTYQRLDWCDEDDEDDEDDENDEDYEGDEGNEDDEEDEEDA